MTIKTLTAGAGLWLLCSSVLAHDGILNFEGEAVQSTCVFEGFSRDGSSPSVNPVIALPNIAIDALDGDRVTGETPLWLHFRDCVYMAGHRDVSVTFYTDTKSEDGSLYMPTQTAETAKNVGFQITQDGYYQGHIKKPGWSNRDFSAGATFPKEKGNLVSELYKVAYRKVPGSGAVVPGKMTAVVTYDIAYY